MWKIHASVGGPSKKFINEDTIVPQDSKNFKKKGTSKQTTYSNKVRVSQSANWKGNMFVSICAIALRRIR
jgi:hypothetical protein